VKRQGEEVAALLLLVVGGLIACNGGPIAPSSPSAAPPVPAERSPAPVTVVSGTVFELGRDGAGARVVAASIWGPKFTTTDSAGRYEVSGLHDLSGKSATPPLQSLSAIKDGYSQPCRPAIDRWLGGADHDLNIHLVADDILASTGTPSLLPMTGPVVVGVVFERTAQGRHPAAGVAVAVDFSNGMFRPPAAHTVSDAMGRFTLCGLTQPYRVFWDEGADDFPEGIADVYAHRRAANAPVSFTHDIDVRTLSQLELHVD
jgi:hypothetical protein